MSYRAQVNIQQRACVFCRCAQPGESLAFVEAVCRATSGIAASRASYGYRPMKTLSTFITILVLSGCTAVPIDLNRFASEVGVDRSSISLARSCSYTESTPGVGHAQFSDAVCVILA